MKIFTINVYADKIVSQNTGVTIQEICGISAGNSIDIIRDKRNKIIEYDKSAREVIENLKNECFYKNDFILIGLSENNYYIIYNPVDDEDESSCMISLFDTFQELKEYLAFDVLGSLDKK